MRALLADAPDEDVSLAFARAWFDRPGAATPVDRALRLDTEVMLVDDPVKRVDNMTMAHGLEARTPFLDHELVELAAACPPELKLADGGKGVLKAAARGVVPDAVIDRPKGYFPVPALTHLEGPVLALVNEAAARPRDRGLFRPEAVDAMLAAPERGPHEPRRLVAVAARPAGALAPAACRSLRTRLRTRSSSSCRPRRRSKSTKATIDERGRARGRSSPRMSPAWRHAAAADPPAGGRRSPGRRCVATKIAAIEQISGHTTNPQIPRIRAAVAAPLVCWGGGPYGLYGCCWKSW